MEEPQGDLFESSNKGDVTLIRQMPGRAGLIKG